jgi:hypothetical protein
MTAGSKKGEHRGGRKKGTPNRATVERHLEILKAAGVDNYSARLGRDVLAKVMVELDALAEKYHPARGPTPDEELFVKYATMAAKVAGDLTPYQSPRLAAMMMQSSHPRPKVLERVGVTEREVYEEVMAEMVAKIRARGELPRAIKAYIEAHSNGGVTNRGTPNVMSRP